MKSKASLSLIVLMMVFFTIISVRAPPENQTASITSTQDDGFVTEAGIGFDTALIHVLDPNMDLRAFLVFRDIEVNFWEPLTNATLRLHTSSTLNFESNSTVTIYGVRQSNFAGFSGPSDVLSAPTTIESVSFNTSQFYGFSWFDINVTNIVEELIRNPQWDGEGTGGAGPKDNIGFVIYGAEGYDTRYFFDYISNTGLEAQLVIHWNHAPTPPTGFPGAVFNETYRGYDIWTYNASDLGWINYNDYTLFNVSGGEDFEIVSETVISGYRITVATTDDFRLRRANPSNQGFVLMAVNVTEVLDAQGASRDNVAHFFGHASANKNVFNIDNDLNSGVFLGIATPTGNHDSNFSFCINTHKVGVWNILYGQEYNVTQFPDRRFYLNVTYDYPAQNFIVQVYNDSAFSVLLETVQRVGYANILNAYGNEFAFNTESRGAHVDYASWNTLSYSGTTFIVTDENGTVIDSGIEDYDDALIVIEGELGADPEDPDPPGQDWEETGPFTRFRTRLYIWMIGVFLIFGPVMTFAYKRPSGYAFVIGLFIMLIGLGFLIAAGSV